MQSSSQPILDLNPGHRLKILIGGHQDEMVLAGHDRNQKVKLREHSSGGTKFAEDFGELDGGLLVGGPNTEDAKGRLNASEVLPVAAAQPNSRPIFAMNRHTNPESIAAAHCGIDARLQHRVAVQIGRQVIGIQEIAIQGVLPAMFRMASRLRRSNSVNIARICSRSSASNSIGPSA